MGGGTCTMPSTRASKDSRTKPSDVISYSRYCRYPAGPLWVCMPEMTTFCDPYSCPKEDCRGAHTP